MNSPTDNDNQPSSADAPTPSIRDWLISQGTAFEALRAYSRKRSALLQGLHDVIRDRSNSILMTHEGNSNATSTKPQ